MSLNVFIYFKYLRFNWLLAFHQLTNPCSKVPSQTVFWIPALVQWQYKRQLVSNFNWASRKLEELSAIPCILNKPVWVQKRNLNSQQHSDLDVEQVRRGSHWVVWHVDLQEWVELVVAAAQCRSDRLHPVTPVQGVRVVESERSWRWLIFCIANKE